MFIPGNHDPARAASVWTRAQALRPARDDVQDNAHFLVHPEKPLILQNGALAILPAVLERHHEADDLTAWFDDAPTPPGAIPIGMAQGSVPDFLPTEEVHNSIAANRAEAANLDYLALGDWRGTLEINDRTWYAGAPEPERFGSSAPGKVLVVTIQQAGAPPEVKEVRIGQFVWKKIEYSIHSDADLAALTPKIEQLGPNFDRLLLRLKISGVVDLELRRKLCNWVAEWRAKLRYLEVDDQELTAEPTEDDLHQIADRGFIQTPALHLRNLASDPESPDQEIAKAALIRLYQKRVQG